MAEDIFRAGLDAVDPEAVVRAQVSRRGDRLLVGDRTYALGDFQRVWLIGAGKAAALMARALEDLLEDRLSGGLVIVKYGHGVPLRRTQVVEAGHPIPDQAGLEGTARLLQLLEGCSESDLVIGVFSGGASALLPAPVPPLDLAEKQRTTQLLLECGADIGEINSIRKHLSRSKGGGLARAAYPATLIALILSDVVGDRLDVIASGPTVPDASRFADCLAVVERYGLAPGCRPRCGGSSRKGQPAAIRRPPSPGTRSSPGCKMCWWATTAWRSWPPGSGPRPWATRRCCSPPAWRGRPAEVGKVLAAVGKEVCLSGHPVAPPACLLAGGETTVTLRGDGLGGRNQELALAAALALDGWSRISLLSAGTDGTDGPTDAAGAFIDGATCRRARALGLESGGFSVPPGFLSLLCSPRRFADYRPHPDERHGYHLPADRMSRGR